MKYPEFIDTISQYRFRHRCVFGQTQSGKSNTINKFALEDIEGDHGILYIDFDGEDINTILSQFPKRRHKDLLLIDFADSQYPIAWNPLEGHTGDYRATVAETFVEAMSAIWGYAGMATPDMDRISYNTTLTLIDYPEGTVLGMYMMLVSEKFRNKIARKTKDIIVKDFWLRQFPDLQEKDRQQVIKSTVNKLERFVADPRIRNTLGQFKSAFDLKDAIAQRKIILVKVPQSELGLSKSKTIAGLFVAQFFGIGQRRKGLLPFHVYLPECNNLDTDEAVDRYIDATGAKIVSGGSVASFTPSSDIINMPNDDMFFSTEHSTRTEAYYSILLHELTHWSGHKKRLDRDLSGRFGNEAYAMEELVAELGSAFQCALLGLTPEPRLDHAQYIKNWLKVLKNDKKAIFSASAKAQEAVNYLKPLH